MLAPRAVGVKVTGILQLAPAARVLGAIGQLEVCAKSPEVVIPLIVRGAVGALVRVTVLGLLVVSATWPEKVRVPGLKL